MPERRPRCTRCTEKCPRSPESANHATSRSTPILQPPSDHGSRAPGPETRSSSCCTAGAGAGAGAGLGAPLSVAGGRGRCRHLSLPSITGRPALREGRRPATLAAQAAVSHPRGQGESARGISKADRRAGAAAGGRRRGSGIAVASPAPRPRPRPRLHKDRKPSRAARKRSKNEGPDRSHESPNGSGVEGQGFRDGRAERAKRRAGGSRRLGGEKGPPARG